MAMIGAAHQQRIRSSCPEAARPWRIMFDEFGINAGYVEDLHTRWMQSPQSVDERWRRFFEGNGAAAPAPAPPAASPASNGRTAHANGNGVTTNGNGHVVIVP